MKKSLLLSAVMLLSLSATLASCNDPKDSKPSSPDASTPPSSSVEGPAEETTGEGDITLKMWSAADDFGAIKKMITSFNAAQKAASKATVKVTLVGIGANEVGTKFTSDPTTGPDIFHIPGNNIPTFVKNKSLASFSDSDLTTGKNDIPENTLATGQIDETLYALPYTINTYVAFYRKDILTSNDIKSVSAIQSKIDTSNSDNKGIYIDMGSGFYTQSLIRSLGLNFYGNNGTDGTVTDLLPDNEKALQFANLTYDILHDGKWSYITDGSIDSLASGKNLVNVDGFWNLNNYVEKVGKDKLGIAVLPKLDISGLSADWGSPIDNKFLAVNSAAKGDKGELAKALALYMVSPDGQKIRYDQDKVVPTSSSLLNDETFKSEFIGAEAVNAYLTSPYNFSNPTVEGWDSKYWNAAEAFSSTIKGLTTKDDAAIKKAIKDFGEAILIK